MRKARTAHYLIIATAVTIHAWLCYAPAVQRGFPPMNPYMEYLAPFASIFVIVLAAPLSRCLSRPEIWSRRIGFAIIFSLGLGLAFQFRVMGHATPNHGPYLLDTLIIAVVAVIPTILTLKVFEGLICTATENKHP